MELKIQFSDEGDGEHTILDNIKKELKCENLIYTKVENKDGEFDLVRIVGLPEIYDYEEVGDGGHHGPFSFEKELIDYVKKIKTMPFNEIQ